MDKLLGIYKNPAEVIFKKLYSARVPIISTYSEGELEIGGIPMNVIDGENRNSFNELTTVMITINEMIEKFQNGFQIRIDNDDSALHIYNVIQRHLETWKGYTATSLNQVNTDIDEDLIVLDKFAAEVFDLNKRKVVDSNLVATPAFSNSFRNLLMGIEKPVTQDIDYDTIERETAAPETVRYSKYDLNTLLK